MECSNRRLVKLRSICEQDASILMNLNNDPETAKYVVGNPKEVTIEEQLQWMEKIKLEHNTVRFMVEYDGETAGTVIISEIKKDVQTGNISIKLLKEFRGLGIGKSAIRMALEYCFTTINLFCVTAHVLADNSASLSLFEKSGFSREGILRCRVIKNQERKHLVSYSILQPEFELFLSEMGR